MQALNVGVSEEGDPLLSCNFKTEFVVHLLQRTNGAVTVNIGPTYVGLPSLHFVQPLRSLFFSFRSVSYSKKKGKQAQIAFKKDEMVKKDDVYKSSTVSVGSGEPPNSLSMPPAKRKAVVPRPMTGGKLLKAGGPSKTANVRFVCPFILCGDQRADAAFESRRSPPLDPSLKLKPSHQEPPPPHDKLLSPPSPQSHPPLDKLPPHPERTELHHLLQPEQPLLLLLLLNQKSNNTKLCLRLRRISLGRLV